MLVEQVAVATISEVDEDCWFGGGGGAPTVRAVAQHARSIVNVDPTLPVILAAGRRDVTDTVRKVFVIY